MGQRRDQRGEISRDYTFSYSLLILFANKIPEDLEGICLFYLDPCIHLLHLFKSHPVLLQNAQDFLGVFRYKVIVKH